MPSARLSPLRRLLFASILAGLVVVVLEVVLQAFYFATVGDFLFRRALPPIYAADPIRCYRVASDLDYVHRTNEFEIQIYTNSIGLRTDASHREYAIPKPDDVYRILVTGPSFAFGWGANYEDIFPTLIEQGLRVPEKRVEVMNLGTPSQGSAHQFCWLQKVGYAYQPDMVLHVSYGKEVPPVATECPENLECPTIENGQLVPASASNADRTKAILKRFALVFYGYYAWNAIAPSDSPVDVTKSLYSGVETAVGRDDHFRHLTQTYSEYGLSLGRIFGPDVRVAFVFLPYSFSVYPSDIVRFPGVTAEDVALSRERVDLGIRTLSSAGIPILDTLPSLLENAEIERLYYWLDIHLTPRGNSVVADVAIPFIQVLIDSRDDSVEAQAPNS